MIALPTTIADVDRLILNEVQEDIHLDYKGSPSIDRSKRNEISKDVSAFANSDGGILIYGVIEKDNLPAGRDSGVDHTKYTREWLEQVISSNVTPRIDGIRIVPIPLSVNTSIYAVEIPKSFRAPHQAPDKKYYKRFNFQSVSMEDYEIRDVRNRQQIVSPLINVDFNLEHGVAVFIVVSGIGTLPAMDVTFEFSKKLEWRGESDDPVLFRRGVKYFPPGKSHRYLYSTFGEVLKEGSTIPSAFDVTVSYVHPGVGQRISDTFHLDLKDYDEAIVTESELYEHGYNIKRALEGLKSEIQNLSRSFNVFTTIAGETGLDLSVTTIRNLRHIAAGDARIEKINPYGCSYRVFQEVLDIDRKMALNLQSFFRYQEEGQKLTDLEGMSDELIQIIKENFSVAE